jgi:hypothetical protein
MATVNPPIAAAPRRLQRLAIKPGSLFGWLVLLGFAGCLWPRYFICRSILWLPAVCYLYATYGVGDTLGRYFHPVDWVGIVMMALGLDLLATLIMNAVSSLRAAPRVAAAP